ncbi:MAG: hypothetical protein RLZZ273_1348 [Bacteroidota bacterium]
MQHTSIRVLWAVICALAGLPVATFGMLNSIGSPDAVWPVARPARMYIEGSMNVKTPSTGLDQSISFTAVVRTDTVLFTAMGPFGIVVARVYAQPDSFLVVNYLKQSAIDGDPRSTKVNDLLPIPVRLNDILAIVRCVPPGMPSDYVVEGARDDGTSLYSRKDSTMVEYALIDSVQRVVRQFQRKRLDGSPMLNVQYADVKPINDAVNVPHTIRLRVNDGEHDVTLEYDEVSTVLPKSASSKLQVPRSYTRTSLR